MEAMTWNGVENVRIYKALPGWYQCFIDTVWGSSAYGYGRTAREAWKAAYRRLRMPD
jgi:hypothetical protein